MLLGPLPGVEAERLLLQAAIATLRPAASSPAYFALVTASLPPGRLGARLTPGPCLSRGG